MYHSPRIPARYLSSHRPVLDAHRLAEDRMRGDPKGMGARRSFTYFSGRHEEWPGAHSPSWPACQCADCESSERLQRIAELIAAPLSGETTEPSFFRLVES